MDMRSFIYWIALFAFLNNFCYGQDVNYQRKFTSNNNNRYYNMGNFGLNSASSSADVNNYGSANYPQNFKTNPSSSPEWHPAYPVAPVWNYQSGLPTYPPNLITPYYLIDFPTSSACSACFNYDQDPNNKTYKFAFNTGNFRKNQNSDFFGNVQGRVQFEDEDGQQDLNYFSNNKDRDFKLDSGTLAQDSSKFNRMFNNMGNAPENDPLLSVSGNLGNSFIESRKLSGESSDFDENLKKLSIHLMKLLDSFYKLPYSGGHKSKTYNFLFDSNNFKVEELLSPDGSIRGHLKYLDKSGIVRDMNYRSSLNKFQIIEENKNYDEKDVKFVTGRPTNEEPAINQPNY